MPLRPVRLGLELLSGIAPAIVLTDRTVLRRMTTFETSVGAWDFGA